MSSVDNRIVKMGFDNTSFKQKVGETIGVLGKLGETLKLAEGVKGLENVANSAKGINLRPLSTSAEEVSNRLSLMGIVGVTALVNVANQAVESGKRMLSSLTIDPIMQGFSEYETKMNAITTIMTNTQHAGTGMAEVTAVLDELNLYADKTIYNFADMTKNIGTFTAAGIGVKESAMAIKGIANLAAGSGSSADQASTAMYQLSQALAAGKVGLQDWNSVVNAGMGGKMFQDALDKTAASMGKARNMAEPFRETLKDGWLTADVLTKTLEQFAADETLLKAATQVKTYTQLISTMKESVQSGWAQTWEIIIGNKDEATVMFTAISDGFSAIMGPMADYRNAQLKIWKDMGGRTALLNGMANIMKAIGKILGPIYEAYKKIIDPWNGARLADMSKGFEWLTSKLILSDKASQGIQKTFEGLFSIVKVVMGILKPIGMILGGLVGAFIPLLGIIPRITGVFADFITKTVDMVANSELLKTVIDGIQWASTELANSIEWLFNDSSSWMNQGIEGAVWLLGIFSAAMGDLTGFMSSKISTIIDFGAAFNETHKPIEKVKSVMESLGVRIGIVVTAVGKGMQSMQAFIKTGMDNIKSMIGSISDKIKNSGVTGLDVFNAGLIGTIIILITKLARTIKGFMEKVAPLTENISGLLGDVRESLVAYQNDVKASKIQKIAIAVLLLSTSILILSKVDPERLIPAVAAVTALLGAMMGSLWLFSKIDPKTIAGAASGAIALIGITLALNILAGALLKLSRINPDEVKTALIGLAACAVTLGVLAKILEKTKITASQGASMMLLATSLIILAGAFKIMASINPKDLMQGLGAMGIALVSISIFLKSTSDVSNSLKVALSLVPLALALNMLASALLMFGYMNPKVLMQGLLVIGALLVELGLFSKGVNGITTNMVGLGIGLVLLAGSMIILAGALGILGNMDHGTLAQGLLVVAASLLAIALTTRLMPKGMTAIGAGILILSVALMLLSLSLRKFGELSFEVVAKGLLTIATTLLIFAGISIILGTASGAMLMFALGIGAIALAVGLFGGAALIFAMGVSSMAAAIATLGAGFTLAIAGVLATIPMLAGALALAIVSFITILGYNAAPLQRAATQLINALLMTLTDAIPVFVKMMTVLISQLLTAMNTLIPQIVVALGILLTGLIDLIINNTPMIIEAIMFLITSVLTSLSVNLPLIVELIMTTLIALISSVLTKLAESVPIVAGAFVAIIVAIIDTIAQNTVRVIDAMVNFVITIIDGMTASVQENGPRVRESIANLIKAMFDEFMASIGSFTDIGGHIIGGLVNGITGGVGKIVDAAKNVASSALDSAKNFLGIHSPSREFMKLGAFTSEGMALGIANNAGLVDDEVTKMGGTALDGVKSAMSVLNDSMSEDISNNPTITPILDLSNVQNGARQLDTMWNKEQSINATMKTARRISSDMSDNKAASVENNTQSMQSTDNSQVYNTFNVTGDNPKQIANEVSRILQKQVERKAAVWV